MRLDIAILQLSDALASYAGLRQGVIAENIANADTPGYKARDVLPFAKAYADRPATAFVPQATRAGHLLEETRGAQNFRLTEAHAPGVQNPNGNTVGIEDQMLRATHLKLQHDLALGVYTKSLSILRAGLGRR